MRHASKRSSGVNVKDIFRQEQKEQKKIFIT